MWDGFNKYVIIINRMGLVCVWLNTFYLWKIMMECGPYGSLCASIMIIDIDRVGSKFLTIIIMVFDGIGSQIWIHNYCEVKCYFNIMIQCTWSMWDH